MDIVEVTKSKELGEFIDFSRHLYDEVLNDPNCVLPLNIMMKILLNGPSTEKKKLFLAKENGRIVARLAVKVHKGGGSPKLHFGFFEALPDQLPAVRAIFHRARQCFPDLEMMGPYHFRSEDPFVGTLIKGHQYEPYFFMAYNPPYYQDYLEALGFESVMDVHAYDIRPTQLHESMYEKAKECESAGYTHRWMSYRSMKRDVKIIAGIFNNSLAGNWGFEELNPQQLRDMYLLFRFFIDPRAVCFAQKDGVDIGCLIMMPNFNPIIKPGKGKLTPSVLWNILTRPRKKLHSIRGYAIGLINGYQGQGLGSYMALKTWEKCETGMGYNKGELSWVLKDNNSVQNLIKKMNGEPNRTYRIYQHAPFSKDEQKTL